MSNSTTDIKTMFHYLKYGFTGLSVLLSVWLALQLFFPWFGGSFPQRTRGPLANEEYYKLGVLPDWESKIDLPGSKVNLTEMLNKGEPIPALQFTIPQSVMMATDSVPSASQPMDPTP